MMMRKGGREQKINEIVKKRMIGHKVLKKKQQSGKFEEKMKTRNEAKNKQPNVKYE